MKLCPADKFAQKAADEALRSNPFTYAELDCQAFVEYCLNQAGGLDVNYRGSNDMFRNMCTEVYTLAEVQQKGLLRAGTLLFIVEPVSGSTPAQYRTDGLGDASHVGVYCDMHVTDLATGKTSYVEVAHSSKSKGGVVASTVRNGWTHCGVCKHVDYGVWGEVAGTGDGTAARKTMSAVVGNLAAGTTTVNMRETPSAQGKYMLKVPEGTALTITGQNNGFAHTTYSGFTGWVDERFLVYEDGGTASAVMDDYVVVVGGLSESKAYNLADDLRPLGHPVAVRKGGAV